MFRRAIAGLILGPALLLGSLAWTGFLALRTVFDENRTSDIAQELFDNEAVRDQLASNLASALESAAPDGVEVPAEQIDRAATVVLDDPRIERLIVGALGQTHRAFLGQGDAPQDLDLGPVLATAREQVDAVAPGLAERIPEELVVELPTERIPDASPVKGFLERTVPLLAAIAVVLALLALLTTSDRPSVLRRAAYWAISTTLVYLVVGIGIPWLLRELAPDQAEVLAALLAALLRTTLVPSIALGSTGAVLLLVALVWPAAERRRAARPTPAPAPAPPVVSSARRDAPLTPTRAPRAAASAPAPPPRPPAPDPTAAFAPPPAPDPTATFAPPPSPPARPPVAGEPVPPPRPTLPTRAKPPEAVDLPAWTGEPPVAEEPKPKWLPPTWVEGHGWVMDPDDPREPPANARFVDGVGWVVPGPPPDA